MASNDLTLEKLEISKRLSALESKFDVLVSKMETHSDSDNRLFKVMSDNLEKLNILIIGDGDKIGLVEDMRATKSIEKNREGHVKVFYAAIIAGFCDFIWRNISHFFNHGQKG